MFRFLRTTPIARTAATIAAASPHVAAVSPFLGRLTLLLALLLGVATTARAQSDRYAQRMPEERSGPRFGVTYLGGAIPDSAKAYGVEVSRMITQWGYQFERQFFAIEGGPTAVNEWILLIGGLEQSEFIPSISWIVGLRLPNDIEFGAGPNVGAGGTALVLTAGRTWRQGGVNVPVNLAVVPSKIGTRVSVMTGFNMHR